MKVKFKDLSLFADLNGNGIEPNSSISAITTTNDAPGFQEIIAQSIG